MFRIVALFLAACLPLFSLLAAFSRDSAMAAGYDRALGRLLREALSSLFGLFPFSLTEVLLWALPFLLVPALWLGVRTRHPRRLLSLLLSVLLSVIAAYTLSFAPGLYKPPLSEELGLPDREPTAAEVEGCLGWLTALAVPPARIPGEAEVAACLRRGLLTAEAHYGITANRAAVGKRTATPLFAKLGYFGLYAFPLGEVTVSDRIPTATGVFTLAHEMAHASGYAREEEADLVALLSCLESRDPYLIYAAASGMLGRMLIEVERAAPAAWERASGELSEAVRQELFESGEAYERGLLPTVADSLPTYSGTVRLLCAFYRARVAGGT